MSATASKRKRHYEWAELGRPFGLILADIDGLKAVNDRDGHAAGNDLLRRAADLLGRKLDCGDQLARVGGDEFAIITSAPGADAVRGLCARLTAALHEQGLTMSFGWAVYTRDGDTSLLLFRAADERLFAQKVIRSHLSAGRVVDLRPGRNCCYAPARAERRLPFTVTSSVSPPRLTIEIG